MKTVVHVTHEALQKIGGIGTVLEGLCTSETYRGKVGRDILAGPIFGSDTEAAEQLARIGEVHYAAATGTDTGDWGQTFGPIQERLGVSIIYGRRTFSHPKSGAESWTEVLLFGIGQMHTDPLNVFKFRLHESFGIASDIYDAWDYEQYTRMAVPLYDALEAMGVPGGGDEPVTLLAHEYMGVPSALKIVLEGDRRYRTFFYAHETATVRRIVEKHPGHDTMFYNTMHKAYLENKFLEDVFGSQRRYFKHPLVTAACRLDGALAVGDLVREELQWLEPAMRNFPIRLAYNGIPAYRIEPDEKLASRRRMLDYLSRLIDLRPDLVMSHVTRLTVSKGLWRDLKVLWHIETALRDQQRTAVMIFLSTEIGGPKQRRQIDEIAGRYGWPVAHREGHPDLSDGEAEFYTSVQRFNAASRQVKILFVNQFGWSPEACGSAMPEEMSFKDIRQGTDVEFGQSIYEPFGIAQLEPLAFGGICVPSNICGCAGFLKRVDGESESPNVVIADYTRAPEGLTSTQEMLSIGMDERTKVEEVEAERVAGAILDRLPAGDDDRARLLESGYGLAEHMGWDTVAADYILPALDEADARE